MPAPFSFAPIRPEESAVGSGSVLNDIAGAGPNPYPASMQTYIPSARERIRNYLSDMMGGGHENAFKAEKLTSLLDLSPLGSFLTANDAGRTIGGGLSRANAGQVGYGAGLMQMAHSPGQREALVKLMASMAPGVGAVTHGMVPKALMGMGDNVADWGLRAGIEPFEFGKEGEPQRQTASMLPFSLAPTR